MKIPFVKKSANLQTRFLVWVLLPPFMILIVLGIIGYWVLSVTVESGELDSLKRISSTTASKLEQEISLRKNVLKGIGEQIFDTKTQYSAKLDNLDAQFKKCSTFVAKSTKYTESPEGTCVPFYAGFAGVNSGYVSALSAEYTRQFQDIGIQQSDVTNRLMDTYTKFFPDAQYVLVTDTDGKVISSAAASGEFANDYVAQMKKISESAAKQSVEAKYLKSGKSEQLVFAYPLAKGVILAAYSLDSNGMLYRAWKDAPLDSKTTYMVIADKQSGTSYPAIKQAGLYKQALSSNSTGKIKFTDAGVSYLSVAEDIKGTAWRVIVASPTAYALGSLADTQMIAIAVVGTILAIFVFVGSVYLRRITSSVMALAAGSVIFSSGQLTHRIDVDSMSDEEFAKLAESMNSMAEKIQLAEEEIDRKDKEFISVATHEIRAPLTAIIGNLSMVVEDGMGQMDNDATVSVSQAYKSTQRLRDLVNELLDVARLESGRTEFNFADVDFSSEVTDMIELQKTVATEKGVTIQFAGTVTPLSVFVDKSKFEIILTNFLSNAIKYNRPNGVIEVSATSDGEQLTVSIKDSGLGIPEAQKGHMFEKFFRVSSENRTGIVGTGLGLYATKQLIEGMGGKVWFDSTEGVGTTFHFTVPVSGSQSAVEAKAKSDAASKVD